MWRERLFSDLIEAGVGVSGGREGDRPVGEGGYHDLVQH